MYYRQIAGEELNVKEVEIKDASVHSPKDKGRLVELDVNITPALKREGNAREVIRHIQSERKKAGLLVSDRILLSLSTTDHGLRKAINEITTKVFQPRL